MSAFIQITPSVRIPLSELRFRTSRSGGPGGQNVNKLETRVELMFDVANSPSLTDQEKSVVLVSLGARVDSHGMLRLVSQQSRSQWENKRLAISKFESVLRSALKIRKKRVKTKPTAGSKEKRVQAKRLQAQKKSMRRVRLDHE